MSIINQELNLIGIDSNGRVVTTDRFGGVGSNVELISPNQVEIDVEQENPNWDGSIMPNSARPIGTYIT